MDRLSEGATSSGRLMVFDLDSLNQRERWESGFSPAPSRDGDPVGSARSDIRLSPVGALTTAGSEWFTGVLRTADLLSETILVTDAQLLDGVFFLGLGVERVLSLLGRRDLDPPAITVLGRGPSLEESLRRIVVDAQGSPTGFDHAVLRALQIERTSAAVDAAMDRVHNAPPGAVAEAIGEALRAGNPAGSEERCAELINAWQGWVQAERCGLIGYETYGAPRPEAFTAALGAWSRPAVVLGDALLDQLLGTARRSEAFRLIDHAVAGGSLTPAEAATVTAWWERGYADHVAQNNHAN